jgi:hypothetical protein
VVGGRRKERERLLYDPGLACAGRRLDHNRNRTL